MVQSPIVIYYQYHPDATIKEYLEYEALKEKEKKDAELERQNKCLEWYKALEGRYFLICFNSNAYMAVKVTKWPDTEFKNKYICYNIGLNPNNIIKEENRDVNRYWFKNPYEKPYFGQNEGSCKEISEEKYNEIVEKCARIEEITNSINVKNL